MTALLDALQSWWNWERRSPLIFALKFFGFVVAFAACALIFAFIDFEIHYDDWNPNADRIVRGVETGDVKSNSKSVALPYPFADAALTGLPGVEVGARVQPLRVMLQHGQDRFNEMIFFADPSFLDVFPVTILKGNSHPLNQPNSVLISERAASRYFGERNPVGQVLSISGQRDVTVTAVMKDWRADSHIRPDFLVSLESFFAMAKELGNVKREDITGWDDCHCYTTYLLLHSSDAVAAASAQLHGLLVSQQGEEYAARTPIEIQKLGDIYLGSANYASYLDHAQKGDPLQLAVFASMTLVLLLIAGLSFANFSTAQATLRAREFAVRRVLGAQRSEIVVRITAEAVIVAVVAAIIGFGLAVGLMPLFAGFVNRPLAIDSLLRVSLIAQLMVTALAIGAVSGIAPGIVIARISPLALLLGHVGRGDMRFSGQSLRKVLLGLQFVVSCVLIVFALAVQAELSFVRKQPLGFEPHGTLILNGEGAQDALGNLMEGIVALPGVNSVAIANAAPTEPVRDSIQVLRQGQSTEEARSVFINNVDFHFMKSLGIRMLQGRTFDPAFGADSLRLASYLAPETPHDKNTINGIIDRLAAKELGFDSGQDALGKVLRFPGPESLPFAVQVIGVSDDVRYGGPREPATPMLYLARTDWEINLHQPQYIIINTDSRATAALPAQIVRLWNELVPSFVGDISYLEDRVANQVENEQRQFWLVSFFVTITVLLSVLGILGFAAFSMRREARDLAIRRVLGATREEIALVVSSAQLRVVIVAVLIGCPLAWWAVMRWLSTFVMRTPISLSWFAVGPTAIAALSFAALFVFTFRLAAVSPVEYLRAD